MVVERLCPICHLRIVTSSSRKHKDHCQGHDLGEIISA
jgi:hypothetical protein